MNEASFWRRRPVVVALWVASVVIALIVGGWAAVEATQPPQVAAPRPTPTTVEVVSGSVSVEQSYGINVSWLAAPAGVNGLGGTLTSIDVVPSGSTIEVGAVVYTVDLNPAVAIEGAVPAFRDMATGMSGADVEQLQSFLIASGYLAGTADGHYGPVTASAVNRWSAALGVAKTGTVPLGRVVFIPTLPAILAPAPDVRVGMSVAPGDSVLVGATADPEFSFPVLPEAVSQITTGMQVSIDVDGATWNAQVNRLGSATDDTGTTIAILGPVEGAASICAVDCATAVTLGGKAVLAGRLILVPETTGAQIPTAAISTDASGSTMVTLADGTRVPVAVLASSDGKSIVKGVDVGDRIVLVASAAG
ncbi:MAG: peptidoglycan-binding domain-containing protein [Pseudolysinimonas sp.]|uniref:peptidoglycan-binding domain-containing protein n=1 Tax=Pseudolysinimonas sp. TaxID=2680009 RepID=UPI0032641E20